MYEYCGENTAKCLFVSLDKRAGFAFATKYVDRFFWLDGKVDGGGGRSMQGVRELGKGDRRQVKSYN